ncbi:hypothetical protein [Thermoflavimicrobium dichotomicum]|nr:hypothetical protein [Thermoflavimicrobium dichotomicum]
MGSLWIGCDGTEVVTEKGTHPEAREKRIQIFKIASERIQWIGSFFYFFT